HRGGAEAPSSPVVARGRGAVLSVVATPPRDLVPAPLEARRAGGERARAFVRARRGPDRASSVGGLLSSARPLLGACDRVWAGLLQRPPAAVVARLVLGSVKPARGGGARAPRDRYRGSRQDAVLSELLGAPADGVGVPVHRGWAEGVAEPADPVASD